MKISVSKLEVVLNLFRMPTGIGYILGMQSLSCNRGAS